MTPLVEEWGSDTPKTRGEEYLQIEYITTFHLKDFEEKQSVGSFLSLRCPLLGRYLGPLVTNCSITVVIKLLCRSILSYTYSVTKKKDQK